MINMGAFVGFISEVLQFHTKFGRLRFVCRSKQFLNHTIQHASKQEYPTYTSSTAALLGGWLCKPEKLLISLITQISITKYDH